MSRWLRVDPQVGWTNRLNAAAGGAWHVLGEGCWLGMAHGLGVNPWPAGWAGPLAVRGETGRVSWPGWAGSRLGGLWLGSCGPKLNADGADRPPAQSCAR
ncbi:hypothetical protein Acy02nite_52810 [Actinoplanes cyaneus]|uniref:Uncharacterized protein n=1 Tax=Actinoplanes cyaneus TaxID=52696 RepID=A0A919M2L9_9ACTN|nr:hypothetical protein [Actinoplanes cyaneus]GID67400.1 hypothetical protein Acy02nite_52810 [Actinoplanes cyaneus]